LLLKVDGVKLAHALTGPDDLICYIEAYNPPGFKKTLDQSVRSLITSEVIQHTETLIILADRGLSCSGEENNPAPAAAWIFCNTAASDAETAVDELMAKKGVVNAHPLLGRYDMIAYVEAFSLGELMQIVDGVRQTKGILSTDTRLVLM
jgi:hypothetical protein